MLIKLLLLLSVRYLYYSKTSATNVWGVCPTYATNRGGGFCPGGDFCQGASVRGLMSGGLMSVPPNNTISSAYIVPLPQNSYFALSRRVQAFGSPVEKLLHLFHTDFSVDFPSLQLHPVMFAKYGRLCSTENDDHFTSSFFPTNFLGLLWTDSHENLSHDVGSYWQ